MKKYICEQDIASTEFYRSYRTRGPYKYLRFKSVFDVKCCVCGTIYWLGGMSDYFLLLDNDRYFLLCSGPCREVGRVNPLAYTIV